MGPATFFGLALFAASLVLFVVGWKYYRRQRVIADTPTAKARSMAIGPVEIKGTAIALPPTDAYTAPFSGQPALCWRVQVEEERTRTVTTRQGGKTVTRTEKYWATIYDDFHRPRFGLRDETGVAVIDPAKGDPAMPAKRTWDAGFLRDPPALAKEHLAAHHVRVETWLGLNRTLRLTESRLPPDTTLYVLGTAVPREHLWDGGSASLVVQKEGRVPFILSDHAEGALVRRYATVAWACLLGGIGLATGGVYLLGVA